MITLDNVACEGDESSILQCPHNGLFNHDCIHSEDVGVICNVGGKIVQWYPSNPDTSKFICYPSCEHVPPLPAAVLDLFF